MRTFLKFISIFLLTCISLLSCEREETPADNSVKGVSFYLADGEESATRSVIVESFAEGDAVGVYVVDKSASKELKATGNFADNKRFVWSSEKKSFIAADNDNLIFNSPDRPLEFYVYFPYQSDLSDATAVSHTIMGREKEDDFLFARNGDTGGNQRIPLSFKHLLSKVTVKYTAAENRDAADISAYTYVDMTINLADGSIAATGDKRADLQLERMELENSLDYVGIIPPQTYKQGEKFATLAYSGGGTYSFSFPEDRTFVSGEENEVFFMPKEPAFVFTVNPTKIDAKALDTALYPFTITSTKSDAINGTTLPSTTHPIGYKLKDFPTWVTVSGQDIKIAENRVATVRTGTVSWIQDESEYVTTCTISQAAANIQDVYNFTFSDGSTATTWSNVAATGDKKVYTITSNKQTFVNGNLDKTENITFSSERSAAWITVSGSTLTVAENRTTATRTGTVTFTQSVSGKKITVTVTQAAGVATNNYVFTFSDGSTTAAWNNVAAVGATKGYTITSQKKVYINGTLESTTSLAYASSSSVAWITVSGSSVVVAENRTTSPRSGVVTFTQNESGKKITVNVAQEAGTTSTEYTSWSTTSLSLSASPNPVAATGGSSVLTAKANQTRQKKTLINGIVVNTETETQTVTVTPSWTKISGSGTLSGTSVVFGNNTSASVVSGVYQASYGGKTAQITVSQSAGSKQYGSWSAWNVAVSANPPTIASTGGTSTITATATRTRPWTWNGVAGSGGTETENATPSLSVSGNGFSLSGTTVTASNNTSTSSRTCTVTASHGGKTATCTITQSGGTTTYGNYVFSVSPTSWTGVSASGASKTFTITSTRDVYVNGSKVNTENVGYSGSSTQSWATVSGATVTVGDNPNTTPRGAVITFTQSGSGKTATVSVMQLKKNSVDIN